MITSSGVPNRNFFYAHLTPDGRYKVLQEGTLAAEEPVVDEESSE